MKWFDIREYAQILRPLTFIIGGRGIGKTYSALSFMMDQGEPFIYMRNTDTQMKESGSEFGNPFKRLNLDRGTHWRIEAQSKHYIIYDDSDDEKIMKGYGVALSTFENLRGVDLSDVRYVIFDEFIELRSLTFDQFRTFSNFYETVNRNRELLGDPPLKVILLSNAQSLSSPILQGYGLVDQITRMTEAGTEIWKDNVRLLILPASEVSEAKKQTALYQATRGTSFYQEAIENKFAHDSFAGVKKRNLREYVPYCAIDGIYVYRHKSSYLFYVSRSAHGMEALKSKDSLPLFLRLYGRELSEAYVRGLVEYESYSIKLLFTSLIVI